MMKEGELTRGRCGNQLILLLLSKLNRRIAVMMKLINQRKGTEPHALIHATPKEDLHGQMIGKIEGRIKRKVAGIQQGLLHHRNEDPDLGIKRKTDLDPAMLLGKIALNPAMPVGKIAPGLVMPIEKLCPNLVILKEKIGLAPELAMPIAGGVPAPTRKVGTERKDRDHGNDQQVNAAKSRDPNLAEESRDRQAQVAGTLVRREEGPDQRSASLNQSRGDGKTRGTRSLAATRATTQEVAVGRGGDRSREKR